MTRKIKWRWEEGVVDALHEHIEIRYGDKEDSYDHWIPVARISRPKRHKFLVERLIDRNSPAEALILSKVSENLDFFLVEHDIEIMPDHWEYAIYHCSTMGNMYGDVHWAYFPKGNAAEKHSSEVIELSTKEAEKLFGDPGKAGKYIKRSDHN